MTEVGGLRKEINRLSRYVRAEEELLDGEVRAFCGGTLTSQPGCAVKVELDKLTSEESKLLQIRRLLEEAGIEHRQEMVNLEVELFRTQLKFASLIKSVEEDNEGFLDGLEYSDLELNF